MKKPGNNLPCLVQVLQVVLNTILAARRSDCLCLVQVLQVVLNTIPSARRSGCLCLVQVLLVLVVNKQSTIFYTLEEPLSNGSISKTWQTTSANNNRKQQNTRCDAPQPVHTIQRAYNMYRVQYKYPPTSDERSFQSIPHRFNHSLIFRDHSSTMSMSVLQDRHSSHSKISG